MPVPNTLLILLPALMIVGVSQDTPLRYKQQRLTNINYCGSMPKAEFLSRINSYTQNTAIESTIESMFPANKSLLIAGLVEPNSQKIMQSIKGHEGLYFLHIGVIAVFLVIHLIVTPLLFCCGCCTCLTCCKKYVDRPQTCQKLCLPATCIIMLIITLIVISSIIIKLQVDLNPKIEDFKCSVSLITHDVIDGGDYQINKDNVSFVGLNYLRAVIGNFGEKASDINATLNQDLTSESKTVKSLKQLSKQRQDMIARIPNQDTESVFLQYPNPLLSPVNSATSYETSTFVPILGNINLPNSLVSNLSISSKDMNQTLQNISIAADNLSKLLTSTSVKNMTTAIKSQVESFQQLEFQLQNTIGMAESGILKVQTIATYVLLGLTIFISGIMCLQLLCLQSWRKRSCSGKYACCCSLLWLIGLLIFVLAIAFGLANPVAYYGCQYARQTVSDSNSFETNARIFGNTSNDVSTTLKNCLASSTNKTYLFSKMVNQTQLSKIKQIPQKFPKNLSFLTSWQNLSQNYSVLQKQVQQYYSAAKTDLPQQSMINQLKQIAGLNQIYQCFSDRWIPSINQSEPAVIGCANFTLKSDSNSCNNWDDFQRRSVGCVGCMDTFSLLSTAANAQQIQSQLMKRYRDCNQLNINVNEPVNKLVTLWQNYYQPKQQILGAVKQRSFNLATNLNLTRKSIVEQITASYNQTQDWLASDPLFNQSVPSSLSPETMDCRVLGISIANSVSVACNNLVPYVYQTRLLYYAAALLLFFVCICSTCLIGRNTKQGAVESERSKRYVVDWGNPPTSERRYSLGDLQINSNKAEPQIKRYF